MLLITPDDAVGGSPCSKVLFPTKDIGELQTWYGTEEATLSTDAKSIICKTLARKRMQVRQSPASPHQHESIPRCAFHNVFAQLVFLKFIGNR